MAPPVRRPAPGESLGQAPGYGLSAVHRSRVASGTVGMLAEAQSYLREHHAPARLYVYGQGDNKYAVATAAFDMLIKHVDHNSGGDNVPFGNGFTSDQEDLAPCVFINGAWARARTRRVISGTPSSWEKALWQMGGRC
jgi:N-6 DNA Methylase